MLCHSCQVLLQNFALILCALLILLNNIIHETFTT